MMQQRLFHPLFVHHAHHRNQLLPIWGKRGWVWKLQRPCELESYTDVLNTRLFWEAQRGLDSWLWEAQGHSPCPFMALTITVVYCNAINQWHSIAGRGWVRVFAPQNIFFPPFTSPQMISNVLKLDQIRWFQHKKWLILHAFWTFCPLKHDAIWETCYMLHRAILQKWTK